MESIAVVSLTCAAARAGANRVACSGRTARGALKPGTDRGATPGREAAGNRSHAVTLSFTVVRR